MSGLDEHARNLVLCNRVENASDFPTPHVIRAKTRDVMSPVFSLYTAAYLRREFSPGLIHAHFGWSGIRVLLLKHFLGIPLITSFGGRDIGVQMHEPWFDRLYEMLFAACDRMICVSDDLRSQLEAHGVDPARIVVIRRGVPVQDFPFHSRTDRPPDAEVQLLAVGRLVEKKGHSGLLEALAPLIRSGARVRLTVLGSGEGQRDLERVRYRLGLQDVVRFESPGDRLSLVARLHEADVLVHPSVTGSDGDTEGIPNTVLEAAATGLPVVATHHGGIPEVVREGVTGLLVPERDGVALSRALGTLVSNASLRWRMGQAGHQQAVREFDLRRQVEAHLDLYKEVKSEAARRQAPLPSSWLGPDYLDCAKQLFRVAPENSISALYDRHVGEPILQSEITQHERGWLSGLYALRRLVPLSMRTRIKSRLLPLVLWLLGRREARGYGSRRRDLRRIEERITASLDGEAVFELPDEQWSVLAERLICLDGRLQVGTDWTIVDRTRWQPPCP